MAKGFSIAAILVLISASIVTLGMAQQRQQTSACLTKLVPCLNYLNSTRNPPSSCCNPLKSIIKSEPECLCALISTSVTNQARQAGINVDRASELPGRCGQHVNPLACLKNAGKSRDSASSLATTLRSATQTVALTLMITFAWLMWVSSY